MEERCENCQYHRRLKHNFKTGIGFEEANCCVLWVKTDDSQNVWVQEVDTNGMCECFTVKENG